MRKFEIFDPTALSSPATAESAIESRSDWPSGGASTASLAHKLAMNCAALAEFGTRYLALRPERLIAFCSNPHPSGCAAGMPPIRYPIGKSGISVLAGVVALPREDADLEFEIKCGPIASCSRSRSSLDG